MSDNRLLTILKHPLRIFMTLGHRHWFDWMSDELYLKIGYRCYMHKKLNIDNPKTYNEKLQWLKINDRRAEYTTFVDKYAVRKIIKDKIGEDYLIPLVGGPWKTPEEIDFDLLPDQFVLKCNHNSGGIIICKDKTKLNIKDTIHKLKKWLKNNSYPAAREWPYKNVKPLIIAEKYMVDESGYQLKDYKFFCFNGIPKALFVATDRATDTKFDFFDMDFNHLPIKNGHENSDKPIKKPIGFDEMKEVASILSKGIPQIRVDLYDVNGKIYFGELTMSHWGGTTPFEPEEWDYKFGEWIKLPIDE